MFLKTSMFVLPFGEGPKKGGGMSIRNGIFIFIIMITAMAGATEISVKATKKIGVASLKKDYLIHSNRAYCYRAVPEEIAGKDYILHDHKAVSDLDIKVIKGGELYVCIFDGDKTEQLKSGLKWQKMGVTLKADSNDKLTVYKTSVKNGQKFKLNSLNRWGTVVFADKISGVKKVSAKGRVKEPSPTYSNDSYVALQKLIADYKPDSDVQKKLLAETFNKQALILSQDKTPVDVVLRRSYALLEHIEGMDKAPVLKTEHATLDALKEQSSSASGDEELIKLFDAVKAVRRKIAFKNPLLDFDRILFIKHNKMAHGDRHMVDQYLGFTQDSRGGVYVLDKPFSDQSEVKPLLAGQMVQNGRLKGRELHENGSFISLELDYEAEHIYFAYTEAENGPYTKGGTEECRTTALKNAMGNKSRGGTHYAFAPGRNFAIFRANADGSELTALTQGDWNDFDPCVLPSGRLAFISDRIGGNQRCGGRFCSTYTLHGMMPDGSDIIPFSYHDTNEWHPSVDNKGMIIYTRWDYVDRDSDIAHHIWHCYPDGRDPRSYHGNYPIVREMRPWMEMSNRAIPNSHRYIAVSTPHHGESYGSMVMIDIRKKDDGAMSQLKRITPEVHFPESEAAPGVPYVPRGHGGRGQVYGQPWPLSENFYICSYSPEQKLHGMYLVDCFGNKELLYQDKEIGCLDPIPFRPRIKPPIIAVQTQQAKADRVEKDIANLAMGTVTIMNIYEADKTWPENRKIKSLRVVNVFAKPNIYADRPNIGYARQSLCRGVLGTVPVEEDGSVHFKCPTGVPIYFQALDEKGMMIQNMRSVTYLHPGETLSCIGCHEDKHKPMNNYSSKMPIALRRAPSELQREPSGSYPLTFPRLVQPVLDAKCVGCHEKEKKAPCLRGDKIVKYGRSAGFETLKKYAWGKHGGNGSIKRNIRSYSIPGQEGFVVSKLYVKLVKSGHKDVKLTTEELRRISLWVDCNSNFFGAYVDTEQQAKGEIVQPLLGLSALIPFDEMKY